MPEFILMKICLSPTLDKILKNLKYSVLGLSLFIVFNAFAIQKACAEANIKATAEKQLVIHEVEHLSKVLTLDRIYKSMEGPTDNQNFRFVESDTSELIWLVGMEVDIVGEDGKTSQAPSFLCHTNVSFDSTKLNSKTRREVFGLSPKHVLDYKFIDMVQGHNKIDFPKHFGVPLLSNEPFKLSSMVMNWEQRDKPIGVMVKMIAKYVYDRDFDEDMIPLLRKGSALQVPIKKNKTGKTAGADSDHAGCATEMKNEDDGELFQSASDANLIKHKDGEIFSYHWFVPPGRHVYRYTLDYGLRIPWDTTLHVIVPHVHVYATYIELRDLTENKSLFKGKSQNFKNNLGLESLDHYSSEQGIPVYKDHQYEIVTEYNNPTKNDIDAMAMMYMYFRDKEFDKKKMNYSLIPKID